MFIPFVLIADFERIRRAQLIAFSSSLYKTRPDSVLNGSMHNAAQPLVGVQMLYYRWNRLIEGKMGETEQRGDKWINTLAPALSQSWKCLLSSLILAPAPADLLHVARNPIRTWIKLIGRSNIDWKLLIIN